MNDDALTLARGIAQGGAFTNEDAVTVAREYLFLVGEQLVLTEALAMIDPTFTSPLAQAEKGGDAEQHREPVSPPDNTEVRGLRIVH